MSVSSLLAGSLSALMSLSSVITPADHLNSVDQPNIGIVSAQDETAQPGAHAHKGRMTGDNEELINAHKDQATGFLQSGKLAVQRELALATEEVGHEFLNIDFKDNHTAHLTFPATFNHDTDQAAVDRVLDALKINGYDNITAAM
ncbi:hypothetical protein QP888_08610 [Corynebacterium sp. MSK297]|uniref:hypothetical protein n=1 Tax=Corynebacterium sp. MSK297 TaxID=3050221 RepID=UPI00254A0D47|nr:hypothetical protein [Corynebacterium sp. MSK297]MDK8846548.1 hypothetical protein [Corynebacterium sp. MSK297]